MATTVTLNRYNGSGWDILDPSTTQAQVSGLTTALGNKLETSLKGSASGLAELDVNGTVPESQLPSSVFGGMQYVSAITADTNTGALKVLVDAHVASDGGSAEGRYFIASTSVTITFSANTGLVTTAGAGGEESDYQGDITLEAGDWFIFDRFDSPNYIWGVINNTYGNASESARGIVYVASQVQVDAGTGGVLVVTAGTLNSRLADYELTTHNHDGDYLGIGANAVSATKLVESRNIALTGHVTGTVDFDGTAHVSMTTTVGDNTHDHNGSTMKFSGASGNYISNLAGTDPTFLALDTELYARNKVTYLVSEPTVDVRTNDIWFDAS